jgi:hypothetical protein
MLNFVKVLNGPKKMDEELTSVAPIVNESKPWVEK